MVTAVSTRRDTFSISPPLPLSTVSPVWEKSDVTTARANMQGPPTAANKTGSVFYAVLFI